MGTDRQIETQGSMTKVIFYATILSGCVAALLDVSTPLDFFA